MAQEWGEEEPPVKELLGEGDNDMEGDCGGGGDMLKEDILSKHGDGELGNVSISRRGE